MNPTARAALGAPWPWLTATCLPGALDAAQAALEPCPQGEILEDDDAEPILRAVWPGLTAAVMADVDARLAAAGARGAWSSGPSPWEDEAERALVRGVDVRPAGPGTSQCAFDPATGRVRSPDLSDGVDHGAHDAASALVAAVRDAGAISVTDAGPDSARGVLHRPTGRLGVQLVIPDPGDPDAILAAVGAAAWASGLDPALVHDPRQGLSIVAWVPDRRGASLPPDLDLVDQSDPLAEGPADLPSEVHAVVAPEQADAALRCADMHGLVGGASRWGRRRGQPCFLWAWTCTAEQARGAAAALRSALGPDAARALPGAPSVLTEHAAWLQPSWLRVGDRVVLRLRSGATDREVLPPVADRPATSGDRALAGLMPGVQVRPGLLDDQPYVALSIPWDRWDRRLAALAPLLLPGTLAALTRGEVRVLAPTPTA